MCNAGHLMLHCDPVSEFSLLVTTLNLYYKVITLGPAIGFDVILQTYCIQQESIKP